MLRISADARRALSELLSSNSVADGAGLRIFATSLSASMDGPPFVMKLADEPEPGDEVIAIDGARVFVGTGLAPELDESSWM